VSTLSKVEDKYNLLNEARNIMFKAQQSLDQLPLSSYIDSAEDRKVLIKVVDDAQKSISFIHTLLIKNCE